jgi:hypothetical protein
MEAEAVHWRQQHENWRLTVFFAVLLLHVSVGIMLARSSRLLIASRAGAQPFFIDFLRRSAQSPPTAASAAAPSSPARPNTNRRSRDKGPKLHQDVPANPSIPASPDTRNAITMLPPIDWTQEAEWAVNNQMQAAEREKLYRNLSGLSAAQLEWIRRNHMEPVDTNPPWAENRPKNNAVGVLWLSENCALVNLLPFCRIELGRKPPRGDLFKNMHKYLEERELEPLP